METKLNETTEKKVLRETTGKSRRAHIRTDNIKDLCNI
jgi:hypothetical protein